MWTRHDVRDKDYLIFFAFIPSLLRVYLLYFLRCWPLLENTYCSIFIFTFTKSNHSVNLLLPTALRMESALEAYIPKLRSL